MCIRDSIYVGLMGVLTAYAHVFRSAQTSASIGWLPSPFEYEVGMADLTVGVLGILCLWLKGNFWLASAVPPPAARPRPTLPIPAPHNPDRSAPVAHSAAAANTAASPAPGLSLIHI